MDIGLDCKYDISKIRYKLHFKKKPYAPYFFKYTKPIN
jgi:hypothetical protein